MECFICTAQAEKIESGLDGVDLICPECGAYGLSGTLVAIRDGRKLDAVQTRFWLERQRDLYPNRRPVISDATVYWAF